MTATLVPSGRSSSIGSMSATRRMTSARLRPQVGHDTRFTPRERRWSAFRISYPTRTSRSGLSVSDTRSVSPTPCASSEAMPAVLLTIPPSPGPASVRPTCRGKSGYARAIRRLARTVSGTEEDFAERMMSSNPFSSNSSACSRTARKSAAARSPPASSSWRPERDPPLAPIRMTTPASFAARIISSRRPSGMFPGLMRMLRHPASIAAKARAGSKWMSAMRGSSVRGSSQASPSASDAVGRATRASSHPSSRRLRH